MRREWDEERSVGERLRREAAAKMEQDRASINTLRDELARIKTRMEEARYFYQASAAKWLDESLPQISQHIFRLNVFTKFLT